MEPDPNLLPDTNLQGSLEASPRRVTPQEVEKARTEKRAAMTKLLDDMEVSVDSQGQYFVKIGEKKPITEVRQVTTSKFMGLGSKTTDQEEVTGYEDTRAFILKAPVKRDYSGSEVQIFYIVTPDDIYATSYYTSEVNNPDTSLNNPRIKQVYDTLMALTKGDQTADDSWKYIRPDEGEEWRRRIQAPDFSISLYTPDVATISTEFQQAITESINMTESPYKQQAAEAREHTQVATDMASMIRSLPPRE